MTSKPRCFVHLDYMPVCSQERLDIQRAVRVLTLYMSKPTKMALNALKKLAAYLAYSKDMRLWFEGAQMQSTRRDRWRSSTLQQPVAKLVSRLSCSVTQTGQVAR